MALIIDFLFDKTSVDFEKSIFRGVLFTINNINNLFNHSSPAVLNVTQRVKKYYHFVWARKDSLLPPKYKYSCSVLKTYLIFSHVHLFVCRFDGPYVWYNYILYILTI